MSIVRWLRHWFKTPYAVRAAFSEQALEPPWADAISRPLLPHRQQRVRGDRRHGGWNLGRIAIGDVRRCRRGEQFAPAFLRPLDGLIRVHAS